MREIREVKLERLQQFAAFGISDDAVREYEKENVVPFFYLAPEDYALFGCKPPKVGAPTIAVLFGREDGFYALDWDYVLALAKLRVNIRALTYEHTVEQMQGCQALLLPGGAFVSPEWYYTDPTPDADPADYGSPRAKAYVLAIRRAVKSGMPILGVCAGAQMLAAEVDGWKMLRSLSYLPEGHLPHKTSEPHAHKVKLLPETPLKALLHNQASLVVNSRHEVTMVVPTPQPPLEPEPTLEERAPQKPAPEPKFQLYAVAPDGVPEAWGSAKMHILCVQWHPENAAALGDAMMQRIYDWLGKEAKWYHELL